MNNKQPFVSVIMPVYNAGGYVADAIDSIMSQTYKNFELICIDDASTDNSLTILKGYKKRYPQKIKIIALSKNQNCGGDMCANQGIKIAKGDYIARMDADDIAKPQRLEKQVAFLQKNQHIFLCGSQADIINAEGVIIGKKKVATSSKHIYQDYFRIHPIIHPTIMFRNEHRGRMFYRNEYSANNDYYTLFMLLTHGKKFVNLKESLLYYRIHSENDTLKNMKNKLWNTIKIRFEMMVFNNYRPTPKNMAIYLFHIAVGLTIPEQVLKTMYFYSKGIKKQSVLLHKQLLHVPAFAFKPSIG